MHISPSGTEDFVSCRLHSDNLSLWRTFQSFPFKAAGGRPRGAASFVASKKEGKTETITSRVEKRSKNAKIFNSYKSAAACSLCRSLLLVSNCRLGKCEVLAPARRHTEKAPAFLTFLQEQCGSHCFEAIGLAVDRFAQLRTTVTSFQNFGEVHFFFSLFSSFDEVQ